MHWPSVSVRLGCYGLVLGSVLVFVTAAAWAQTSSDSSFVGVWQGSLPVERAPRIVVRISSTDRGSLRGVFTWIDQDSDAIAFSAVTVAGQELAATSDLLNVGYRGKLVGAGNSMTGTWTQDKRAYSLLLTKVAPESEWKHNDALSVPPMSADADPQFDVASIRLSPEGNKGHRYEWRTRQFRAYSVTVTDLIKFAFQLRDRQIKGAPAWTSEVKFDIAAQPDAPGLPTEQQYHTMMRKLLVGRFGLHFQMDQLSFPVYALTRGTRELTLTKSDRSFGLDGHIAVKQEAEDTVIRFDSESMPELLGILMNFIDDRQVVDETGLTGSFTFSITVPSAALQSLDANERASAFLRGVQPLGLEIVRKKADLPVMTVNNIERPSPN